ncbi:VOC family protein [Companilactobacillus furfuricola]|uniref:VOC family protein n=1 Tax=Companilactobacillus furfuricola TaxID=1462575 RepID=UPI000F7A3CF0|nr:VOC family protein [Companilactobacillus furfuricola]
MHIAHVGVFVEDLDKIVAFYKRYFDVKVSDVYHNEQTSFSSRILSFDDGAKLEVCSRDDVFEVDRSGFTCGFQHVALSLGSREDVDELTERIEEDGYDHLDGPRVTGDGFYESVIADPEGNLIELTV